MSQSSQEEQTRDRFTLRRVWVYEAPQSRLFCAWEDLTTLVRVERSGWRGTKPFHEERFFISSYRADAAEFGRRVREHWSIENGLHWVKDVILREDECGTRAGQAPQNLGLLRSVALTLVRRAGEPSMTQARRKWAHDCDALLSLIE